MSQTQMTRKPARKFTEEEKLHLLRECRETSTYSVAKRNEIQTSILYRWRQELGYQLGPTESVPKYPFKS